MTSAVLRIRRVLGSTRGCIIVREGRESTRLWTVGTCSVEPFDPTSGKVPSRRNAY